MNLVTLLRPALATAFALSLALATHSAFAVAPGSGGSGKSPTVQKSGKMPNCMYHYNMTTCKIGCSPAPCIDKANKCGGKVSGCTPKAKSSLKSN